jgi:hypothetical protein
MLANGAGSDQFRAAKTAGDVWRAGFQALNMGFQAALPDRSLFIHASAYANRRCSARKRLSL